MPTKRDHSLLRHLLLSIALSFAVVSTAIAQQEEQNQAFQQEGRPLVPQTAPVPQAQGNQQQKRASAWTKMCDEVTIPVDTPSKEKAETKPQDGAAESKPTQTVNLCLTLQERFNNTNGALVFSTTVRRREGADAEYLSVFVPHGLDLRVGVQAKVDAGKPIKLDFVSCSKVGCNAEAKLSADWINSMKSGRALSLQTTTVRQRTVSFALPLTDFAAAYDGAPTDAKQYREARQKTVATIRARRAEEVKKAVQEADQKKRAQQQHQQQQSQQPLQQQPQNQPAQTPPPQ